MEVMLPDNFNRDTMYRFISKIIGFDRKPISDTVDFNFSNLKFITPVGITVLSNFHEWLVRRGVSVGYRLPPVEEWDRRKALIYLDDSLFFEQHIGEKRRPYANPRETTQPLTFVEIDESYQWFDKIINWLSIRLKVSRSSLANLKMCLQEIFNNIKDHSSESLGCAFIQHFPYLNTVTIAISDFGVGIPHNISKTQPSLNDAQCIVKATEEGFSTWTHPHNRGAGLVTLIDNVVGDNKGTVFIHSNNGVLECSWDDKNEIVMSSRQKGDFYPGTLIEINLRTENIENVEEDKEEFEW